MRNVIYGHWDALFMLLLMVTHPLRLMDNLSPWLSEVVDIGMVQVTLRILCSLLIVCLLSILNKGLIYKKYVLCSTI
nr:hypothetical protein I308_05241 [Cryptococcus tetragattii IND107]